jgi:hypothetical protein
MGHVRRSLTALVLAPMLASATPASACLNAVEGELNKPLKVVKAAEQHLFNGKLLLAAINVKTTLPDVRERRFLNGGNFDSAGTSYELTEAAVRTMALVSVRTGGAWIYKKKGTFVLAVPDEQHRLENIRWAVESLRLGWLPSRPGIDPWGDPPAAKAQAAARPGVPPNPRDASNLAEALALLPEHHAEAKSILEDLAAKDVITSASAYAALARLRAAASDTEGTRTALQQCGVLGGKRARFVCVSDEPKPKFDPALTESAPRGTQSS